MGMRGLIDEYSLYTGGTVFIITGIRSFHRHNLVETQFMCTKILRPELEIMLYAIRISPTCSAVTM